MNKSVDQGFFGGSHRVVDLNRRFSSPPVMAPKNDILEVGNDASLQITIFKIMAYNIINYYAEQHCGSSVFPRSS